MVQVTVTRFKSQEKIRPIGGRLRKLSDQLEHFLRILEFYFCIFLVVFIGINTQLTACP